jgi:hypothetical protein
MKISGCRRLMLLCLVCIGWSSAAPAAPRGWTTDYDEAQKKAQKENKIMLLNFMGDRDKNKDMDKIHHELLLEEAFYEYAEGHGIILVDIVVDADKDKKKLYKFTKKIPKQYNVDGYPVILFATPKEEELGRTAYIEGGPAAYFKLFDEWRAKFEKGKGPASTP